MIKLLLAASLCANLAFYLKLSHVTTEWEQIKAWACVNGNGGHECGED